VPASDGVGEVVALGAGVTRCAVGDRVSGIFAQRWLSGPRTPETWASTLGGDLDGMLQELVVLHEDGLVRVPPHLTDAEAAALPTSGVAAWQALVTQGKVKKGESILVQGTGAVALFALQIARAVGAHVIATSSSRERSEQAKALGAIATVSRTDPDWTAQVRELTQGRGVDHVIEVSGDLSTAIACLCIGGLVSQIGYLGSTRTEVDVFALLLSNARVQGITVGPRSTFEEMNAAVAGHGLRPVVGRKFEFGQAPQAFSHLANEIGFGKTVLVF
jgi:NADPH:quinone reductase-like Zn-dependent oxidoreductase